MNSHVRRRLNAKKPILITIIITVLLALFPATVAASPTSDWAVPEVAEALTLGFVPEGMQDDYTKKLPLLPNRKLQHR